MKRILDYGTFDPGMTIDGKVVKGWHRTNTGAGRDVGFGTMHYDVGIDFVDGSSLYATMSCQVKITTTTTVSFVRRG